ncbi:MAG TPA: glycosyltransferase, partial [Intrasporangium sp.]|nr:glycosyltransferase [Intrasporangium sp.]
MTDLRTGKVVPDATGSAALRVAVVGPTHPHKGGVAAHTTMLAHHLTEAGHDVTLVSWAHLYPSRLHHADATVPEGVPEVPPYPRTVRALSWARPDTWVRTGRRLRDVDAVIVVHVMPQIVPAHLALLRAADAVPGQPGRSAARPQSVVVCHNVLPHESRPGDAALMRMLFARVDATLVHS